MEVEQQSRSRTERFRRKDDCCSQAIIGTEAKEVYDTSFQSISTSFVLSRDRGVVEATSTASDISSIGTAYQIAKSRITCYDLASRHSHRRRQQGPSEVRIAVKAEQLYQNSDPEGGEVVQACNSRLTTSHWCMESEMTDLRLLTPFSCGPGTQASSRI